MDWKNWFRPPRTVLTLFLCLMATSGAVLAWLGWQVIEQDRDVEAQRQRKRLESTANLAVVAIERELQTGDVQLRVSSGGLEITPANALAFAPFPVPSSPSSNEFLAAEALEFQSPDPLQALNAYEQLAETRDATIRAGALVRLGRVLRKQRRWRKAIGVYRSLKELGSAPVANMPASLVARLGLCSVLHESGDSEGLQREAKALWNDLTSGYWKTDRATLESVLSELESWIPGQSLPKDWSDRMVLAEVAAWAYQQDAPSGRQARQTSHGTASVSWDRSNNVWTARLSSPSEWNALWKRLSEEASVSLQLTDIQGAIVYGEGTGNGPEVFLAASSTKLPWNLAVMPSRELQDGLLESPRRQLMVAGLLVFAALFAGGSFLIARALSRELALARLQADFTAAVSHEFRTPLTSIRQLTEMLAKGRMANEDQKKRAYELMMGESDRLRRLVESLLDLGRMQAGSYRFKLESLDASAWAEGLARAFQETVRARGFQVAFSSSADGALIQGDREALSGVLWNLLDNAAKYSQSEAYIEMSVFRRNNVVEISVKDRGMGISKHDLKHVFDRFYRGSNTKAEGIPGTGIGLAIVKEIVEAHDGTVRAESELGSGSVFRITLPCKEF